MRIHYLKKKKKDLYIISIYMIRLKYHTYIKCWAHKEYVPCFPHEFLETLQKPVNHSHSGTVWNAQHTPQKQL